MVPPMVAAPGTGGNLASTKRRDNLLIDQAWGNIRLEYPEVTREQVAERLQVKRAAELSNGKNQ